MPTPAADDAAEIWPRLMRLRRICFGRIGLPTGECWCRKAAADGTDIPCGEATEPTAFDLLGKPNGAASAEWRAESAATEWVSGTEAHYRSFRDDFGHLLGSYDYEGAMTLSFMGRTLPNHCDTHGVVWGDGEHECCGLCADEGRGSYDYEGA